MKKKYVFLGDIDSINIELVFKSYCYLKNNVKYILLGNIFDFTKYCNSLKSKIKINEINDPIRFKDYDTEALNIFNIENVSKEKYKNLINQINISNYLANLTKFDLVTLPINKSIFKKKMQFNGMTEYLAKINKTNTKMLMVGEKFSIIPLTTHVNLNSVRKVIKINILKNLIKEILFQIQRNIYNLNYNEIRFICYNPHCSENDTIGIEDKVIIQSISRFKKISGPFAADSAFKKLNSKLLFISTYHDQALIPFKLLNQKGINFTLGLNYKRLSPAHGTANDIKFKNIANISSYLACMKF